MANNWWKDLKAFEADGDTWEPSGKAIEELGWSFTELYLASAEGNLLLGGDKLRTKVKEVHGKPVAFVSRSQIDQAFRAKEDLRATEQERRRQGKEFSIEEAVAFAKPFGYGTKKSIKKL